MIRRKSKLLAVAGILTVIGLLLASCGPATEQPTGEQPTGEQPTGEQPTGEQPVAKEGAGIFRVVYNRFAFNNKMDPVTTNMIAAGSIVDMIWDSLVKRDVNSNYVPALAESWKIADDAKSITFTLRQGVKFHNGDPFTAKDVKFSIDLYRDPKAMNSYTPELRDNISETIVDSDYQFTVRFNKAYPGFLDRCADRLGIMPMDYYNSVGKDGFASNPVGIGPFKVTSFKPDESITLEAVQNHYRQTPSIKGVKMQQVSEATTRFAMLKTGEIDMMVPCEPVLVPDLKRDPNLRSMRVDYYSGNSLVFLDLAYANEPSPWKDIRVRQAASYAIDRKVMCEKVFNGVYTPMGHFLAPYNLGYDPSLDAQYPPPAYDPVKAKQLLTDAGYPNGIDVIYPASSETKYYVEPLVAYFNDVGIKAKMSMYEAATLSRKLYAVGTPAAELHGIVARGSPFWIGIKHAGFALYSMMGGGSTSSYGVVNPAVKAAIEASFSITGEAALKVAGKTINDLELKDLWSTPLWVVNTTFGVGPRVAEYTPVLGKSYPWRIDLLKLTD